MIDKKKDNEVICYIDTSLINTGKKKTKEEIELDKRNAWLIEKEASGNKLSRMGLISSMDKDDRKFQLQALINKGEIITLQSAMSAMNLSRGTIISYLKEMELQLYDPDKNKFFGANNGKQVTPW